MKKCECGAEITRYSKQCWECYLNTRTVWNKGKKCPQISAFLTGRKRSEESKRKQAESKRGKPSGRKGMKLPAEWRKNLSESHKGFRILDRSKLSIGNGGRESSAHQEWKKQVRKRDGEKCRISNEDCVERLETHHILSWRDYPELRYKVNNGITLCSAHHPRKRIDEERMVETFQRLVTSQI